MPQAETNNQAAPSKSNISHLQYIHPNNCISTHNDDEIDLIELIQLLIKHKFTILLTTTFSLLSAIIYLSIATPVFQAESFFYPPSSSKVQPLNISWLNDYEKVSTHQIYSAFLTNLKSKSLQKQFFEKHNLKDHFAGNLEANASNYTLSQEFSELITAEVSKDKYYGSLSIKWSDPIIAAKWANDYVKFAEEITVNFFYTNIRAAINKQISEVELNIASKRKLAQQRREDRIALLEESAKISKTLGIDSLHNSINHLPSIYSAPYQSQANSGEMYIRGEKALLSEAQILRDRKSDDAFIPELRDLQEELEKLRSLKIDTNNLSAISLDQPAFPPVDAINPKKLLVLVLAVCLGAIIGTLIILIKSVLTSSRTANS